MDYQTMQRDAVVSAINPEGDSTSKNGGCNGCQNRDASPTEPERTTGAEIADRVSSLGMGDDNSALWFVIGILIVLILLKKR